MSKREQTHTHTQSYSIGLCRNKDHMPIPVGAIISANDGTMEGTVGTGAAEEVTIGADVEEIVAGAVVGAVVGTLTDAVTGAITGEVTGTIPLACTTPLADTIPPPVTLARSLVVPLVVPLVLTGIEYLIEV